MNQLETAPVPNAIILAAGVASRFAPLSFERPKAMFEVRGEILVERLIRQLHEAGITDITVVVGYMKEELFYLEGKFGVKLAISSDYATSNNARSLYCARERLTGTYICSADQYFATNIFNRSLDISTLTALVATDKPDARSLSVDDSSRVVTIGEGPLYMQGPVYLSPQDAVHLRVLLEGECDEAGFDQKLWDDVLTAHLDEFALYACVLGNNTLFEFNYLSDLMAFDTDFFANVDSHILDNICATLKCERADIAHVEPVSAGLTNLSLLFEVDGVKYVYRHPGPGTDQIISREAETCALEIAKRLGLDETFIHEDPLEGWKISLYMEGCSELDYRDRSQVERALHMARTLHTSGETMPWTMDFMAEAIKINGLLADLSYPMPSDHAELTAKVVALSEAMQVDVGEPVLCHNDFYGPNFLVRGDEMWLIDWEYAAMSDYACDIGNFISQGSGYTVDETIEVLDLYYGRPATPEEVRHCLAAVGVVGYYWYVWAMYQGAMGNPVGEWLYIWYKAAQQFTAAAAELYE